MDWDMGDKDDLLGEAAINLNLLEPFKPQEIVLTLDGKSGVLRLKMLFKPDYVTRSRQGSSTFSGTFAAPGKIVGAPVKESAWLVGCCQRGFIPATWLQEKQGQPRREQWQCRATRGANNEW